MITEDYVSFETAKLLKEKGFNAKCDKCYAYFADDDIRVLNLKYPKSAQSLSENRYPCITLQMAMRWLREVHKTFISIIYENDDVFTANLKVPLKGVGCMIDNKHNCWFTYEEACEIAIKYCLEYLI